MSDLTERLAATVAAQAAQIAALQGEIDTYDDIVSDLRAKIDALEAEVAEWEEHGKTCRSSDLTPFVALTKAVDSLMEAFFRSRTRQGSPTAWLFVDAVHHALAHPSVQRAVL